MPLVPIFHSSNNPLGVWWDLFQCGMMPDRKTKPSSWEVIRASSGRQNNSFLTVISCLNPWFDQINLLFNSQWMEGRREWWRQDEDGHLEHPSSEQSVVTRYSSTHTVTNNTEIQFHYLGTFVTVHPCLVAHRGTEMEESVVWIF